MTSFPTLWKSKTQQLSNHAGSWAHQNCSRFKHVSDPNLASCTASDCRSKQSQAASTTNPRGSTSNPRDPHPRSNWVDSTRSDQNQHKKSVPGKGRRAPVLQRRRWPAANPRASGGRSPLRGLREPCMPSAACWRGWSSYPWPQRRVGEIWAGRATRRGRGEIETRSRKKGGAEGRRGETDRPAASRRRSLGSSCGLVEMCREAMLFGGVIWVLKGFVEKKWAWRLACRRDGLPADLSLC